MGTLYKVRPYTFNKGQEIIRSEEHTSELQSRLHLVCRLLLEKTNELQSRLHLVCRLLLDKKTKTQKMRDRKSTRGENNGL